MIPRDIKLLKAGQILKPVGCDRIADIVGRNVESFKRCDRAFSKSAHRNNKIFKGSKCIHHRKLDCKVVQVYIAHIQVFKGR